MALAKVRWKQSVNQMPETSILIGFGVRTNREVVLALYIILYILIYLPGGCDAGETALEA